MRINNHCRQCVVKLNLQHANTIHFKLNNLVLPFFVSCYLLHHPCSTNISCDICDEDGAPHLDLDSFDHLVDDSLGSLIPSK